MNNTFKKMLSALFIPFILYVFFIGFFCIGDDLGSEPNCSEMLHGVNYIWTIFVVILIWIIVAFPNIPVVRELRKIFTFINKLHEKSFFWGTLCTALFWSILAFVGVGISFFQGLAGGNVKRFITIVLICAGGYSLLYVLGVYNSRRLQKKEIEK